MKRLALLFCLTAAAGTRADTLSKPLVFSGTCDASAAFSLSSDLFAVASDEDNLLRFYRVSRPGKPVHTCDLGLLLSGRPKGPELDLEGAARIGQRVYLISSHGRNADGKVAPGRHRFFALECTERDGEISVQAVGKPYSNLAADLARDPKFARFRLGEAAKLAPKASGSLNIEALTDTPEGTLLIGFRNPIPGGRALVVPLLNPNDLLEGQPPRFGDPVLLDLGGLGLRGMGSTAKGYYLLAGPADDEAECRLFHWAGGMSLPKPVPGVDFSRINPEGICFHDVDGRSDLLILSDDGGRNLNGKDCKDLPEAERRFRAYWLTP